MNNDLCSLSYKFFQDLFRRYLTKYGYEVDGQFAKWTEHDLFFKPNGTLCCRCLIDSPIPMVTQGVLQRDLIIMCSRLRNMVGIIKSDYLSALRQKEDAYIQVCSNIKTKVLQGEMRGFDYVDEVELTHLQEKARQLEVDMECIKVILNLNAYLGYAYVDENDKTVLVFHY